jgi:hypothetical protein
VRLFLEIFRVPIFTEAPIAIGPGYRAPLHLGDAGVEQTIKLMRQLVDQDLANASFVNFAKSLVQNVPSHDEWGEVEAIYDWVHSNIRFTKDPYTKETLYPPSEILSMRHRAGFDCDDISMLLGALYLATGYNARLVTVAANEQSAQEFSHVFTEVEVPPGSNNWIAADAARPGAQFGVQPPMYYRRRAWSLIDDSYQDLSGLRRGHLGYVRWRTLGRGILGLGQDGIDWSGIITQGLQEAPILVGEATGTPTTGRFGTTAYTTGNPYASYMTPYSPGYGIPQAGYYNPSVSFMSSNQWLLPALIIGGVLLLTQRKS